MLIYKGKNIEIKRKKNYFAQMIKSCYWILVTEGEVGGGGGVQQSNINRCALIFAI